MNNRTRLLLLALPLTFVISHQATAFEEEEELEEALVSVMVIFQKSQQKLEDQNFELTNKVQSLMKENAFLADTLDDVETKYGQLLERLESSPEQNLENDPTTVTSRDTTNARRNGPGRRGNANGGRNFDEQDIPEPTGELINLNTASRDELLSLPMINALNADGIIDGRPWNQVEDLIRMTGFGRMKLRNIQPLVVAGPMESESDGDQNPEDLSVDDNEETASDENLEEEDINDSNRDDNL